MSSPTSQTPVTANTYAVGVGTSTNSASVAVLLSSAPTSTSVGGPYPIGKRAVIPSTNSEYVLTSFTPSSTGLTANWQASAGPTLLISTVTTDSGVAVPAANNINLLGTANQLTHTASGSTITTSLSATLIAPGSLTVTSGFTVSAGAVAITSGTSAINISADAAATTVNLATGASDKLLTLGSTSGASSLTLQAGTGNVSITGATTTAFSLGLATGTGAISLGISTAAETLSILSASTITGAQVVNILSGATPGANTTLNIMGGAGTAGTQTFNLLASGATRAGVYNIGTGAAAHVGVIGSTTASSSLTLHAGSGTTGLSLSAAGNVQMAPATGSAASANITLNGRAFQSTHTGLTTAAGATQVFVITNNAVTATTQAVQLTVDNLGANDAQMTIQRVLLAVGTITVTLKNNGAAALNGDVHINGWIMS